MTIEALLEVVPPPVEPFDAFEGPWAPIEAALGVILPSDYKDFVRIYGSGYFMEYLNVVVPKSRFAGWALEDYVPQIAKDFLALRDTPYRFWPASGGLLPVGSTENADYVFWATNGAPETWRIVVWDRGSEAGFEEFDCGLTDFLAGLASGKIQPEAFPDGFANCNCLFEPSSEDAAEAGQL